MKVGGCKREWWAAGRELGLAMAAARKGCLLVMWIWRRGQASTLCTTVCELILQKHQATCGALHLRLVLADAPEALAGEEDALLSGDGDGAGEAAGPAGRRGQLMSRLRAHAGRKLRQLAETTAHRISRWGSF